MGTVAAGKSHRPHRKHPLAVRQVSDEFAHGPLARRVPILFHIGRHIRRQTKKIIPLLPERIQYGAIRDGGYVRPIEFAVLVGFGSAFHGIG